jgi:hypothetical protein
MKRDIVLLTFSLVWTAAVAGSLVFVLFAH